ncbi:MAG: Helicase ATP-binding domain-containing protein [Burkholderia sp.]|jgi:superfamily II DNA or RNA helicase
MKYELFDFQKKAVADLLSSMKSMRNAYRSDGRLTSVSLTAPTGAGKTVIAAAVAEGLFFGNESFSGDPNSIILWLSDSPSLNTQTMLRFGAATDLLTPTSMEVVGPEFPRSHERLMPGKIYFLNRQLLSKKGRLSNGNEGGRTFYDVLSRTIEDTSSHLFLFIDEAHRGIGKEATNDSDNKTIYANLIDGEAGRNPPMPSVVGISATPERFEEAMKQRQGRDIHAAINVSVQAVRDSGLIKDFIELRTPKNQADTRHQDLTLACAKLAKSTEVWKKYCQSIGIPQVVPLMVVQVEDKVSNGVLEDLCSQILESLPWLEGDCFANVFGEHEDLKTAVANIPYCPPEKVSGETGIRVLFAKDAISTGWDCPRAEVIYSRRKRNDPTYIAQLIGRMIRTPLARRVNEYDELNTVSCYLPEFDAHSVQDVVARLQEDNVAVDPQKITSNTATITWFGNTKQLVDANLESSSSGNDAVPSASSSHSLDQGAISTNSKNADTPKEETLWEETDIPLGKKPSGTDSPSAKKTPGKICVVLPDEENGKLVLTPDDAEKSIAVHEDENEGLGKKISRKKWLQIANRMPLADAEKLRNSLQGILSRRVRTNDKNDPFLDLWDCVDIITSDLAPGSELDKEIEDSFCSNVDAEIVRQESVFKRSFNEIRNTTISVIRVDPLTGEEFEDRDELVQNDWTRLSDFYQQTVSVFAGASDKVKAYINRKSEQEDISKDEALCRICAVANCVEIITALQGWAKRETKDLLAQYGPNRNLVTAENRQRWDRIEGNTLPYVQYALNISSYKSQQNKNYDRYERHLLCDANGWAYFNLDAVEKKVVETELAQPLTVGWYRNESGNFQASLSIPYQLGGNWHNMYPDFIFFQKAKDGRILRSIVDPHGDWLGDSVAKLKGYVAYLKALPEQFARVLAIADRPDGSCVYLDLMQKETQEAIEGFAGDSAKDLFNDKSLGKPYILKTA